MNHSINEILENMLPSLQYFERKKIFSRQEVKRIIQKRKETEYKLRGLNASPETFSESTKYEIKLEKLRRKRRKRLGIDKIQKEDHAIKSRIHHIFVRGIRKYGNDLSLWWFYFDFCSQSKSGSALSRAFTRCLQLHPHAENVWLRAANWEFFFNGDILGSRKLLQRALEMNSSSCLLWKAFFKLEIKNVQKMRARNKVLNVSDKINTDEALNKLVEEALVPQEIFKLAIKQIPNNPQFLADLASLIPSVEYYPQLMKTAYECIRSLMGRAEVAGFVLGWIYSYHFQDTQSEIESWTKTLQDIETSSTPKSRRALIPEIWTRLQKCENQQVFKLLLKKIAEFIDVEEKPALEIVEISVQVHFLLTGEIEQTISKLEEFKPLFQNNVQWWLLMIDLLRKKDDSDEFEKALWKAMLECGNDERLLLCLADHAETKGFAETNREYKKLIAKAIKKEIIHKRYFLWALRNHADHVTEVLQFLGTNSCMSAQTSSFFC